MVKLLLFFFFFFFFFLQINPNELSENKKQYLKLYETRGNSVDTETLVLMRLIWSTLFALACQLKNALFTLNIGTP